VEAEPRSSIDTRCEAILGEAQALEPRVWYMHAGWASRVMPSEIHGDDSSRPWTGQLYLSGLDHVLDEAWMQWRGTTAIVNFIDVSARTHEPPELQLVRDLQRRKAGTVHCFNIAFNRLKDRNNVVKKFQMIAKHLNSTGEAHVIFHCKNGRDRSAFGILAFLRIQYGYTYAAAMAAMHHRKAACGSYSLVHLASINQVWWDWLETALGGACSGA
jgi:hypothetical protein